MIFLFGDFPSWLPVFTLIGGVTTALVLGLVGAGLAAAGTTAYGIKTGIEGNWPWTDPEAWFTGYAKSLVSPVGEIISDAMGEPSISEQIKGETGEISRGGGSGGELQMATGLPAQLSAQAQQARGFQMEGAAGPQPGSQPQPMGGQGMGGEGGGGASRYEAMDAEEKGPSRGKILGGAWKDIGIQAGIQAAASAIPYVGSAIGSVAGTAAQVGSQFANVAAGASSTAAEAALPAIGAAAAPSFASSAVEALRAVPETIGTTATGILQKSLLGAGMGAAKSALSGEDPLRGAAMGGAGGVVGGIAGYGAQQFAPPPVPTITANPFPMPEINAPSFVGGTAPGAPTLGSFAASKLPSLLGSGASQGVGYMMTPPQPPQPDAPVYSSRPSYYDVYDIGGPNATYGGRRPYWGG